MLIFFFRGRNRCASCNVVVLFLQWYWEIPVFYVFSERECKLWQKTEYLYSAVKDAGTAEKTDFRCGLRLTQGGQIIRSQSRMQKKNRGVVK